MDHPVSEDIAREMFEVGTGRFDGGSIWISYCTLPHPGCSCGDCVVGWIVVPKNDDDQAWATGCETFEATIEAVKRWRRVDAASTN